MRFAISDMQIYALLLVICKYTSHPPPPETAMGGVGTHGATCIGEQWYQPWDSEAGSFWQWQQVSELSRVT